MSLNFNFLKFIRVQTWLSFWNTLFWLSLFVFYFNKTNFLDLILFSEIVWVILYVLTVFYGSLIDDFNLYSLSFFLLALAGLEFSIGILLLVLFKNSRLDFVLDSNSLAGVENSKSTQYALNNSKPLYFNKLFLKKV